MKSLFLLSIITIISTILFSSILRASKLTNLETADYYFTNMEIEPRVAAHELMQKLDGIYNLCKKSVVGATMENRRSMVMGSRRDMFEFYDNQVKAHSQTGFDRKKMIKIQWTLLVRALFKLDSINLHNGALM